MALVGHIQPGQLYDYLYQEGALSFDDIDEIQVSSVQDINEILVLENVFSKIGSLG